MQDKDLNLSRPISHMVFIATLKGIRQFLPLHSLILELFRDSAGVFVFIKNKNNYEEDEELFK